VYKNMRKSIRKAAILYASLDPASAEAVVAQLDRDAARRIREAARTLRTVDPQEQQEVLQEFFAKEKKDEPAAAPAERLASTAGDELVLEHREQAPSPRRPFQFLETIDPGQLAARLLSEHPQTIALVAANAPRKLAAELLWRLPASLRSDVLVRVIDWRPTEPQLLAELEQALQLSLAADSQASSVAAGLEAAREILEAAPPGERTELLKDLAARDSRKADLLRKPSQGTPPVAAKQRDERSRAGTNDPASVEPQPSSKENEGPATIPFPSASRSSAAARKSNTLRRSIPFAEFSRFDDRTLLRVFAAADPQAALLALVGAPPKLVNRLLRRLSRQEAARLQRRMETLGPFPLQDIEAAQEELSRIAGRVALALRRAA
jgi:flagellar motor switch protein FliG